MAFPILVKQNSKKELPLPFKYYKSLGANLLPHLQGEDKEYLLKLKQEFKEYNEFCSCWNKYKDLDKCLNLVVFQNRLPIWLKSSLDFENYLRRLFKNKYLPKNDLQYVSILSLIAYNNSALFLDMGTGKTYITLASLAYLYLQDDYYAEQNEELEKLTGIKINYKDKPTFYNYTVVVCPKKVKTSWKQEIKKFFPFLDKHILITNYESLKTKDFIGIGVDAIIFDESQQLKNPRAKRYWQAIDFIRSKNPQKIIILTGTPDYNNPIDIFSQLILVNPFAFWQSFSAFLKSNFYVLQMKHYKKYIIKKNAVSYIRKTLQENAIISEKAETQNLPPLIEKKVLITISKEQKKLLNKLHSDISDPSFLLTANNTEINKLLKNKQVAERQICSGFYPTDTGDIIEILSYKYKGLETIINKYINDQFIIWYWFTNTGLKLKKMLEPSARMLYGKTTQKVVDKYVKNFQNGKFKYFIINIRAGNFGLNLQKNCFRQIFFELDWNWNVVSQAISRIHRQGQTAPAVFTYFFIIRNTIEEVMFKTIRSKKSLSSALLKKYYSLYK